MPKDDLKIVEIGPGLGDLTRKLLSDKKRVTAFEIDLELCRYLRREFAEAIADERFKLHCGDVLRRWEGDSLSERSYHLVANLPYYVATRIVLKALADRNCRSLLIMIQKEVAEKFAAKEGHKSFSALSVLAGSVADIEILFEVAPDAFVPPPKVTSAVLKMTKFKNFVAGEKGAGCFESETDFALFEDFLREAFRAPRKQLLKNLSGRYPKERLIGIFEELEIARQARPHQLSVKNYHLLFDRLK